jgi:hypothetical protein
LPAAYSGNFIEDAVTYNQGNAFTNNSYSGPWTFTPYSQKNSFSLPAWQASPYSQDLGSTLVP